ncbi:MAG: hydroxysqualene dehydroxylase HpnE [Planctomycetia bacterium]|nr:hydroxysqualene dehydroxylase HpnE [Planctomycetia bacterium]
MSAPPTSAERTDRSNSEQSPSIAIVGGGLAGLAAAAALSERGLRVEVYEARRQLGGRATSWREPESGRSVDFCQHVGMACCTNLADFCRDLELDRFFRRDARLHFFTPDGRRYDLAASPWLPAPAHLLPALLRSGYLSWRERFGVARAMLSLARTRASDEHDGPTIGAWLAAQHQSPRAIELFWTPVLVSALGESIERASLKYARKVFVDGLMTNRGGYRIDVPTLPLSEIYGEHGTAKLRSRGVQIHASVPIRGVRAQGDGRFELQLDDDVRRTVDQVIVAVPWRKAAELLGGFVELRDAAAEWRSIAGAPISGVHLWFDRPLTDLPHAVLIGTLSQWLFAGASPTPGEFYYQVVVSASYDLDAMDKRAAIERIVGELRRAFPAAAAAQLLRSKIVTERDAVFSTRPGIDAIRPRQTTAVPGLFVAGDWTDVGWPATMEGAVRSGRLAAEGVLTRIGRPERLLVPDLPRSFGARLLLGNRA